MTQRCSIVLPTRSDARSLPILAAITGMSLLAGCSGGAESRCFPLSGTLLYRGKPLAEALIVLHPLNATPTLARRPLAYTDADGHFHISTDAPRDGAPAGKYAITVEYRQAVMQGEEMVRGGRNLLPPRFGRRDDSGLKCEVLPGKNPPLILDLSSA